MILAVYLFFNQGKNSIVSMDFQMQSLSTAVLNWAAFLYYLNVYEIGDGHDYMHIAYVGP